MLNININFILIKMKTKHLLIAMALPALFAACTNDELDVVSNDATAMTERKVVENVSLNLGDGVESRLAYGSNGYIWQANDAIGAMLMDDVVLSKYHASGTVWTEWFELTNYIHTNYKFTRDGAGEWTTEAKMCEGNYFFVYPYNAKNGLRNAYTIERDVQILAGTDNASLLKAYANNNAFVGYGKVKSGVASTESVKVDMVPAFGATGITIKNTGTNTYTIEKIVLRGDLVKSKATINPTTCDADKQYSSNVLGNMNDGSTDPALKTSWQTTDFNVSQYSKEEKYWDWPYKGLYDPNWSSYNAVKALKDVLDYDAPTEGSLEVYINAGNVIAPQKSINVIAMLQNVEGIEEATYNGSWTNNGKIVLDIHTDKGLIRDIELNCHYTATNGGLGSSGDDVVTNVLTDKAITAIGDGKSIMVTFDDTSLDIPNDMDIKGNDELANLIHWNANTSAPIYANLQDHVTITKAMYNELAASKITAATINGDGAYEVTIAADVPAGALDLFTFADVKTVYVAGTQTLAKAKTSPIFVNAGATLNVTGNSTYTKITNRGTLNVNTSLTSESTTVTTLTTIVNERNGIMNVAANKKLNGFVSVTNVNSGSSYTATINNAGIIRVLTNNKIVYNTGIIGTEALAGSITNAVGNGGTIYNNVSGRAFIDVNAGSVYANATSTTRMNDNQGNIIITNLAEDGNYEVPVANLGNVVQEIAAVSNTDAIDKRANTIWLSSTLKVEKKDAAGEYVDLNLNYKKANGDWHMVTIVATSANARIDGNYQGLNTYKFVVNDGCKLVLNKIDVALTKQSSGYGEVDMWGNYKNSYKTATITINSNASLITTGGGAVKANVMTDCVQSYCILDDNSTATEITF